MMPRYIEFQAVVLAGGKGSRMTELTAGKPKCLLPVHNLPMIYYPLASLEKAGFTEAIVIVTESTRKEVSSVLDRLNLTLKPEIIGIPDDEELGTADAVRFISDKIHKDFIVISCDLIADIDISEILNSYRKHNASITALMLPAPKVPGTFVTPGPKSKQKPETDLIGIDNRTNRLVFLASASDFEESFSISQKLLRKHTSFTIHSKLLDGHCYVMKKWVLDFMVHNRNFGTLKGELLPYIVSKQLSRPPKQSLDDKNTSIVKMDMREDIFRFAVEKSSDALIKEMSAYNDHSFDLAGAYHGDLIRCYAHLITDRFGLRANTVQMYSFANSQLSQLGLDIAPVPHGSVVHLHSDNIISSSATVKSTQVTNCRIDEGASVDEKTSIKQSHIGPNSVIEPKTRVADSVIMGNVVIKQKCVIVNCILCNNCVIEEGTELKDCLVGAQHVVPGGENYSREVLTDVDRLMEV